MAEPQEAYGGVGKTDIFRLLCEASVNPRSMNVSTSILVDENVPFAHEAFSGFGQVVTCPASAFTPRLVREADVLLVRSVTRVDAALLDGSAVRFVGTATIGTDHVDLDYLRRAGIAFAAAPGSNAESVVEYVMAALLVLSVRHDRPLRGMEVGVVGAGNVGGRLIARLEALGAHVRVCDPPRARQEGRSFAPLNEVLETCDVVTLHTPLIPAGADQTFHLIDEVALGRMKRGSWLVNAARGAVVKGTALLEAITSGHLGAAVLDVWEGEPTPDPALVARTSLATPHIAGYSFDGKVQGTLDLVRALERWAGQRASWDVAAALAPGETDRLALAAPDPALPEHAYLHALARQLYDVEADDARMRVLLGLPPEAHAAHFRTLRRDYPRRRRWGLFTLEGEVPDAYRHAVEAGLGVGRG